MASRPPCYLSNTTVTKHARIVEIGQHQIQKSMKLSQIEKRIQQTLTNSKDIIQKGRKSSRRRSRATSTRDQANEAWALYKSNPSRVFSVDLSRDRYIAFPTLVSSAGIHLLQGYCSLDPILPSLMRFLPKKGLISLLTYYFHFHDQNIKAKSYHLNAQFFLNSVQFLQTPGHK